MSINDDFMNKKTTLVFNDYEQKMLFVSAIIECFEDFLIDKGIDIPNDEKEGDPDASLIYGTDYGKLQDDIDCVILSWHAVDEELESDI